MGGQGGVRGLAIGGRTLPLVGPGGFSVRDAGVMPDLLPNEGFELDADGNGVPDGWSRAGSGPSATLVDDQAHSGERSVQLQRTTHGDTQELRATVPVEPDTVYTVSAWFRTNSITPTSPPAPTPGHAPPARVIVRQLAGATVLDTEILHAYTDTAWWHQRSVGVRTLPATTSISVALKLQRGMGTVWIDDLALRRLLEPTSRRILGSVTSTGSGRLRQTATTTDGLDLDATFTASADRVTVDGELSSTSAADRAVELSFTLPFDAVGWRWHDHARRSRPIVAGGSYAYDTAWNLQSMTRYPWSTVADALSSISIGVPLNVPRIVRSKYGPDGLTLSFDLGLSPERDAPRTSRDLPLRHLHLGSGVGLPAVDRGLLRDVPGFFTRRIDPADEGGWSVRTSFGALHTRFREMGLRLDMVPLGTDSGGGDESRPDHLLNNDAEGIMSSAYNHHWGYKQQLAVEGRHADVRRGRGVAAGRGGRPPRDPGPASACRSRRRPH